MVNRETRVVNCKKEPYDVYIGRPSKWDNPFKIGTDGSRQDVIRKYGIWILANTSLIKQTRSALRGRTLGCWCRLDDCHGDVRAELADNDA